MAFALSRAVGARSCLSRKYGLQVGIRAVGANCTVKSPWDGLRYRSTKRKTKNKLRESELTAEEWDLLSPNTPEEKEMQKIVDEAYMEDLTNLDFRGTNVVTKVIQYPDGETIYDFGHEMTLTTPKALHIRGNIGETTTSSVEKIRAAAKDTNIKSNSPISKEIILPVENTDLLMLEGKLLPNFDKDAVVEGSAASDPVDLAWRMLNFAMESRKPVRGRVLNQINGGFSVAIGAIVCFMPNSHMSPFIKGGTSPIFRDIAQKIIGHQIWVMVLLCEMPTRNVVVSHRTVPRSHLLPEIVSTERKMTSRPRVRREPAKESPRDSADEPAMELNDNQSKKN